MTQQPYTLRLAAEVDEVAKTFPDMAEVSAELRRLHGVNAELLGALQTCIDYGSMTCDDWVTEKACAAIAKATGEQA